MTEGLCTELTLQMRGFTVSSDPYRWSVARTATAEEARELVNLTAVSQFADIVCPDDFTSPRGICDVIERVRTSSYTKKQKLSAFVAIFRAGLVIAGYGDEDNRENLKPQLRLDAFYDTKAEQFVLKCESAIGAKQSKQVRRVFFRMWLCSIEARSQDPNINIIQEWIRFHLSQTNEKNRKWLPVISHFTIEALRILATTLHVKEAHFKHSPRQKLIEALRESEFFWIWEKAFSDWIESRRYADISKAKEAYVFLQRYWCDHPSLLDPELFFSSNLERESLLEWSSKPELGTTNAKKLRVVNQFIRAFVASKPFLSIPDEFDDEEAFLREGYEWPITNSDLSIIADKIGEIEKNGKSNNKSLSEHLLREISVILTENDMGWPKQRAQDWILIPPTRDTPSQSIYCPVLPYMILALLKLPVRAVQLRRLDSGEGDEYRYDMAMRTFTPNTGPHSGYWLRQPNVRNPRRGVLRRFFDSAVQKEFCGFYVNSNKTRDRKVLFDENSGYEIFWEFDELIDIFIATREWQETYNSVTGPIEFENLPPAVFAEPSANVAARKPACFYLFRYPCGNLPVKEAPPTAAVLRTFWYECLGELERRLSTEMKNPPILIDKWQGKTPISSPYHLHGLRLGGLTRLAKAGVSPWILQNIVGGHLGWVMTAYYIQPGFAFITAHLTEHYVKAMRESQEEFAQFLTEATIENVHKIALMKGERAVDDLQSARASKSTYLMATLDNGICPNAQTRCDEGFAVIEWVDAKPRNLRGTFGPVPIMSTGKRDCSRCDFFITGSPFMDGTAVRCSEISMTLAESVDRQRSLMQEIDKIEGQRLKASRNKEKLSPASYQALQVYRLEYKNESDNMVELATSLNANLRKLEDVKALKRRLVAEGQSGPALITTTEEPEFSWGLIHRFEAIDELCRASRWYKSIRVEPLRNERLTMILQIYAREGKPPPLALLNGPESIAAIEALTELLRKRLDRQAIAALVEGYETFESLGLTEDVDSTIASLPMNTPNSHARSVLYERRFLSGPALPSEDPLPNAGRALPLTDPLPDGGDQ